MGNPFDPRPAPPAPAWKQDVQYTLGVLMMMQGVSDQRLADAIPVYDAQAVVFADVIAKQEWEILPLVSGRLVTFQAAVEKERRIHGLINDYRNRVSTTFALNQPFYDAHPEKTRPAFPPMPQELLDYLDTIKP